MKGEDDDTALHEASTNNHIEVVKILIEQGSDVNAIGLYPAPSYKAISFKFAFSL
jgi:ankyrin repeat protein